MSFKVLLLLLLVMVVLATYVYSAIWAYGDSQCRGKPGWAVALLVLLAWWPIGLLAWIVFRPPRVMLRPASQYDPPSISGWRGACLELSALWRWLRQMPHR